MGAEKYKDVDEKLRKQVVAKNGLENYCFQLKNTMNDVNLSDKLTAEDKQTIDDITKEGLQFLESNSEAEAAEIEAKQKDLEAKFNPIMQRIYQQSGAPNGPSDMREGSGYQGDPMEATADDLD